MCIPPILFIRCGWVEGTVRWGFGAPMKSSGFGLARMRPMTSCLLGCSRPGDHSLIGASPLVEVIPLDPPALGGLCACRREAQHPRPREARRVWPGPVPSSSPRRTTHWSRRQQPPLVPRCGCWRRLQCVVRLGEEDGTGPATPAWLPWASDAGPPSDTPKDHRELAGPEG